MSQLTNAYDFVLITLDRHNKRFEIPRSLVRACLSSKLGITSERKIDIHISNMIELGYLVQVKESPKYSERTYDMVGSKLKEILIELNRKEAELNGRPRFFE